MSDTCSTCRYKHILQQPGMPAVMVCRRYPPLASLIQQQVMMPTTITYWPAVTDQDSCGEWRGVAGADIRPFQPLFPQGGSDAGA